MRGLVLYSTDSEELKMTKSEKALELLSKAREQVDWAGKLVFIFELMETAPDWFGEGRGFTVEMLGERRGYIKLKPRRETEKTFAGSRLKTCHRSRWTTCGTNAGRETDHSGFKAYAMPYTWRR